MPLSHKPIDNLEVSDFQRLIDNGVTEGLRIDYKRDTYPSSENKEFLKDATSFANTHGGYIVIGVDEDNRLPTEIVGVEKSCVETKIQRLENWLRDGVEPRIIGYRIQDIGISDTHAVIVVMLPRSMNPPHRVSAQGHNKFYVRNSDGKHEASVEELRHLFGFSAMLETKVAQFVDARRKSIRSGNDVIRDFDNGRLIMHVVNLSSFGDQTFVDMKRLKERQYGFVPDIGRRSPSSDSRIILEGIYGGEVMDGGVFRDRSLIFRDATIEMLAQDMLEDLNGNHPYNGIYACKYLVSAIPMAIKGIRYFGGNGPFAIHVAAEASVGAPVMFDGSGCNHRGAFDRDLVALPQLVLYEFDEGACPATQLRPLLDWFWNAFGAAECHYFDGGRWNPPR